MIKKTRIKDSYIVRTKKRILRDTVDSEAKYTTTFKDIRNYFKIFNKSLFKYAFKSFCKSLKLDLNKKYANL